MMLNSAELVWVKDTFVNCLDTEIDRLILADKDKSVMEYLLEFYITERLYRMLLPADIVKITNELFAHVDARDFILELTDRVSISMSIEDMAVQRLITTISHGLKNTHRVDGMLSIMPVPIGQSIAISKEVDLDSLLYDNLWIVTLVLVLMWFNFSKHFERVLETQLVE
jgi:hypothetical protein